MPKLNKSRRDLITHPVRLRILMTLAGLERTSQQIAAALDDVPASSIYRHLQILLEAGVVEVVSERQVRGAVEKTLRVATGAADIDAAQAAAMSADMHRQAFLIFLTQLLHEFDRYTQQPEIDLARDLAGYRMAVLYASDEEWLAAITAMNAALLPLLENKPGADRKPRRIATISLPAPDEPQENQS
ncbi:MAG TPA: helix-turn-helix domain-containing protein [Herpetosiphonaceae bacterium]